MKRRLLLRLTGGAAAALLLGGHTPYGQWVVYRRKHLLIGCHRGDPPTYALAKRVVAQLEEHLPSAEARVARAPRVERLASLLGTDQMDVATLSPADAVAMLRGSGRFEAYGEIALRILMPLEDRLLVARADFPERHAWLVTGALAGSDLVSPPWPSGGFGLPWHPGSLAFLDGRPEPDDD